MRALSMFLCHSAKAILAMTLSDLAHGIPILKGQRLGWGKLRSLFHRGAFSLGVQVLVSTEVACRCSLNAVCGLAVAP